MSEKEFAKKLLDDVPDCKIGLVIAYIQGITAEEYEDDIFCKELLESYLNAPEDEKEDFTLEECMKDWGLD